MAEIPQSQVQRWSKRLRDGEYICYESRTLKRYRFGSGPKARHGFNDGDMFFFSGYPMMVQGFQTEEADFVHECFRMIQWFIPHIYIYRTKGWRNTLV